MVTVNEISTLSNYCYCSFAYGTVAASVTASMPRTTEYVMRIKGKKTTEKE